MRRWSRIGIYALLVVALILGFSLPSISGYLQDIRTDQTQKTVTSTQLQLEMSSSLTVLQKLRIAAESRRPVELDSGQNLDSEQALSRLFEGLEELFPEEDEEIPYVAASFTEVSHSVYLRMSNEDSLVYWEFWLADGEGNQIRAVVDDDTGLILSLTYTLTLTTSVDDDTMKMPVVPLFLIRQVPDETSDIFTTAGIFGGLEETGSSIETFLQGLQKRYCDEYLRNRGYRLNWETEYTETVDNSYRYSVMLVDNAGGYYMLPFSLTNNEISIN